MNEVPQNIHWREFEVRRGLDSIKEIYATVEGRGYVAGSYAAFMACPADDPILPNDIDIFATSTENADAIAHSLCTDLGFDWQAVNEVVISLRRFAYKGWKQEVQVVNPNPEWKVFPDDILNSFDLDICRALLISEITVLADDNIGFRRGKILRTRNPLRSLKRVLKYHDRGVEFSDHELLKLFRAWEEVEAGRKQEMIDNALAAEFPVPEPPDYDFSSDDDWFEGE